MTKRITDDQGSDLEEVAWFIMENITGKRAGNPLQYDPTAEWLANYVLRNAGDESIHAMWHEFQEHVHEQRHESREEK